MYTLFRIYKLIRYSEVFTILLPSILLTIICIRGVRGCGIDPTSAGISPSPAYNEWGRGRRMQIAEKKIAKKLKNLFKKC